MARGDAPLSQKDAGAVFARFQMVVGQKPHNLRGKKRIRGKGFGKVCNLGL